MTLTTDEIPFAQAIDGGLGKRENRGQDPLRHRKDLPSVDRIVDFQGDSEQKEV